MLWYKAWRESSLRFLLSAAIITLMCLVYTLFQSRLYPAIANATSHVHNYTQYIHWTIFGGATRGILQLSCLLLGLGGLQRDRKQNTLGFTLALPVSRSSLIASRAVLGVLQVFVLALIPSLVVTAASQGIGQQLPLGYSLRFIPLWAAGGIFTYAISFLASVLFPSEYVSLAVAYITYVFYLAAVRYPGLRRFPLHVADFMSGLFPRYLDRATMLWTNTYALLPIAGFLAAAFGLVIISMWITVKQDL
ncbi:ABC-2 transporter permease [Edaphobacter albus]|uniref:ABC-2 transporter permease n=1 Tax=Edaphobacter sp. 4G125 TaxID=2763071 RepID=UPI001644D944|nr:ABC-2 transporter permease [Edaphobacter sp. 4G125]QNI36988.1 ABC-2 transporter permease [Edaphobacter sp. 4G125]